MSEAEIPKRACGGNRINDIYLQCDFHVHTRFSPCAQPDMLPASILRVAKERGVMRIGLTDHVFGFTNTDILKHARAECPLGDGDIEVFFGCEADVLSVGRTAVTQEMIDTLDYIMLSANHFHNDYKKMVDLPSSDQPEVVGRHFLEMFNYAAGLDYADVIAHPLYVMPGSYDVASIYTLKEKDIRAAVELAAANGTAVEISRRSITPDHLDFFKRFYRLCKDAGVKFAVGSDAHNLASVGQLHLLTPLIEDLDLKDNDFWLPKRNGGTRQ
ncbi:MAG: PHP domain-containing protein [Armatimonadota bacterium]|nr:PHP domain-containing protein [Armatimonadota bacterium]